MGLAARNQGDVLWASENIKFPRTSRLNTRYRRRSLVLKTSISMPTEHRMAWPILDPAG